MMDAVWKRISDKRPKGGKAMLYLGIFSALVWIASIGALFLFKDKWLSPAPASAHGDPGAVAEAAGHGEAVDAHPSGESEPREAESGEAESHPGTETHSHGDKNHAATPAAANEHAKEEQALPEDRDEEASETEPPPSREELAALRQLAELHASSGDLEKAVAPMRRVMRMPTRDLALLSLATDIFLGTGNYREAQATARQVLALRPGDMEIEVKSVEASYRLGQVDQALAAAHAALKQHPGHLGMLTTLATMEVELGPGRSDYGTSLRAVLKLKPAHPPALYLQGRKAQLEGDYKDAEAAFRKVIKLEPHNAKALGQLGMALYHLGREKEAEKAYRAELAMNPRDYNTWFNLGEIRMAEAAREKKPAVIQSLRAEAMEDYLKALELNQDHAQAHYRVGVLLNGNGQYKEAIRHLEASLRADSRHVPTLVQLSLAYENLKQPERARTYLGKAYELDPLNKVVLSKLKPWS